MNPDDAVTRAMETLRARTPTEMSLDLEHRNALHGVVRGESRRLQRRAAQRRVGVRALGVLAVVAAAITVGRGIRRDAPPGVQEITFNLDDPSAQRVAVVGEFNGWDATATPMSRTSSGGWRASVGVSPGRYTYSFVVNDSLWIADPVAPRSPERFFGSSKSVLVVASLQ